jgi:micrococcal nuclease
VIVAAAVVLVLAASACADASEPTEPERAASSEARVARVVDGDTIVLEDGQRVRLVQIDAPEGSGECYGEEAGPVLSALLPVGSRLRLEDDPSLDDVDRYGRLLRYVFTNGTNVNLLLVRRGAASVWFFDGDRGRYAEQLIAAAELAEADGRGAWGACEAELDPDGSFQTRPKQ